MRRETGSVAVVVIVVILVGIALLAAVAAPCLLNSVDRNKQKATMQSMKRLAEELKTFHAAIGRFPSADEFQAMFNNDRTASGRDGWRRPLRYEPREDGYLLLSLGKDGELDFDGRNSSGPVFTNSFQADIVIDTGKFVQFPEGMNPS